MEHAPAIYALNRLHAEIGGRIKANQAEAEKLRNDMRHVEAVLKMLEPGFDVTAIAARRKNCVNPVFPRGDVWRTAVGIMREATGPMTARDIAEAMLQAKGITDAPPKQLHDLVAGVRSSLNNHEGNTVERIGDGSPWRWVIRQNP